jgi:hypothetical protein
MRNAVANRKRGGNEPIAIGGHRRIFSDGKRQFREHRAFHFLNVGVIARDGGWRYKAGINANLSGQRLAPQHSDRQPPKNDPANFREGITFQSDEAHTHAGRPLPQDEMRKCEVYCSAAYDAAHAKTRRAGQRGASCGVRVRGLLHCSRFPLWRSLVEWLAGSLNILRECADSMDFTIRKMTASDRLAWAEMRAALWPVDSVAAHAEDIDGFIPADDAWGFVAETNDGALDLQRSQFANTPMAA